LRDVFGKTEITHLPPEAIAGGAAYLALTGIGQDRATEAPGSGPESFRPALSPVPGLVTMLPEEPGDAAHGPPGGNGSSQVIRADESSLDTLTMAEIRNDVRDGHSARALDKLRRLRGVIDEEIARLDPQAEDARRSRG
jgi:hypothetical protein